MTIHRNAETNKVKLTLQEQEALIETDDDHENATYEAIIAENYEEVNEEHVQRFGEFKNIFLNLLFIDFFYKDILNVDELPNIRAGNNFDLTDGQLQLIISQYPGDFFKIEKIKFFEGKASHQEVEAVHQRIINGENCLGLLTDWGSEQKIAFDRLLLRFICTLHTTYNSQSYLLAASKEGNFSYNHGRVLNVASAFARLNLRHPLILARFDIVFRHCKTLGKASVHFDYCVRENFYSNLLDLCERERVDGDEDWEDVFYYCKFMLTLQILSIINFVEMGTPQRVHLLSSSLLRIEKFKFHNEAMDTLDRMKNTLLSLITAINRHPEIGNFTLTFSSLALFESLKWKMNKKGIKTVATARAFFNFLSRGVTFLNLESPYCYFPRMSCLPSNNPIEDPQ